VAELCPVGRLSGTRGTADTLRAAPRSAGQYNPRVAPQEGDTA